MHIACTNRLFLMAVASSFAMLVLQPVPLSAEDQAGEILLRAQQVRQNERAVVAELIAGLRLTEKQARQLMDALDEAARLHVEAFRQQAESLPQMATAFADFSREDSLNQGFSPPVERETARLNNLAKDTREAFVNKMLDLERRVTEILSPAQVEYAKDFQPGKAKAAAPAKSGQAVNGRAPQMNRPRGKGFAARRANRARQDAQPPQNEQLAAARRELTDLSRQMHPELSPIGRYLLHPAAAEPVCAVLGGRPSSSMLEAIKVYDHGTQEYSRDRSAQDNAQVAALRAEINNWNLINGLHLGRKQIGQVLTMWDTFQAQQQATKTEANHGKFKKVRLEQRATVADLELAVAGVLSSGQREVLKDYKACLIPPKNLKDPVRIGQASDNSHLEQWLGNARKAPPRRIEQMIQNLLNLEEQHVAPLKPEARQARADQLRKAAAEAARMTDVDFEISKGQLAERIAPRDRLKELKTEIDTLLRQDGQPGKLAQFMLNPLFMEQLRVRGDQLAKGVVPEPADLSGGPQADNCSKGCALKPKGKDKAQSGGAKSGEAKSGGAKSGEAKSGGATGGEAKRP